MNCLKRLRLHLICNSHAARRKSARANRPLRELSDLQSFAVYRDGILHIWIPDDFRTDDIADRIYEIEYVGWAKPRRYIAIPVAKD